MKDIILIAKEAIMEIQQNKFAFFANFAETIRNFPEDKQAVAYKALCEYGIYGILPEDESLRIMCLMSKASIFKEDGRKNNGGNHNPNGTNQYNKNGQNRSKLVNSGQILYKQKQETETETETKTETESKKNKTKKEYIVLGEFKNVKLTLEEIKKLVNDYEWYFEDAVETLSSYLESRGDKYKSHYAVLGKTNWVWEKVHKNPDCGIKPVCISVGDPNVQGGLRRQTPLEYYTQKYNLEK